MAERRVGAATVLEGTGVVGVVTERDVMEKVVAAGGDPNTTRVRDIMSSPALSVSVNTSVATAAELMRKHHIRHLVVLDEHETLVGMLALRYLLYDLMDDMERLHGRVMNLQKHFGQANEDLQQILISAEKVEKRASRIREVEFEGEEACEPAVSIPVPARLAAGG